MSGFITKVAEVLFARVAPGVFNLASIILVGRYLEVGDYGVFSTALATITFLALLIVGPVRLSIIPRRASHEAKGTAHAFERGVLSLLLLAVAGLVSVGGALWLSDMVPLAWVAMAGASALFGGWMPVLNARLQFWRYGLATWGSALGTITFIYFFVSVAPTPLNALWAYVVGNMIGFIIAWVACGVPMPGRFEREQVISMLGVGSSFTLSNLAENGLFLGVRYIILWLGSDEFFGLFIYAIDLAQRSVGVVINILAFAIVPKAYKISAYEGIKELVPFLKRGSLAGLALAVAVFVSIHILSALDWLDTILGKPVPLVIFSAVSVAVITNRLKKMVIDPIAVSMQSHLAIPVAYILVAPVAMGLSVWSASQGNETLITYIYPGAYICVACLTMTLVYYKLRVIR